MRLFKAIEPLGSGENVTNTALALGYSSAAAQDKAPGNLPARGEGLRGIDAPTQRLGQQARLTQSGNPVAGHRHRPAIDQYQARLPPVPL